MPQRAFHVTDRTWFSHGSLNRSVLLCGILECVEIPLGPLKPEKLTLVGGSSLLWVANGLQWCIGVLRWETGRGNTKRHEKDCGE